MARTATDAASIRRRRRAVVRAAALVPRLLPTPRQVGQGAGVGLVHAELQGPRGDRLLRHGRVETGAQLEVLADERLAGPLELAALDVLAERRDLHGDDAG